MLHFKENEMLLSNTTQTAKYNKLAKYKAVFSIDYSNYPRSGGPLKG